jgi:hypothetical protein
LGAQKAENDVKGASMSISSQTTPSGGRQHLAHSPQADQDITTEQARVWIQQEIKRVGETGQAPFAIADLIRASRISLTKTESCALYPVSAQAHRDIIEALRDKADLSVERAARWANEEIMSVDLDNPYAIADRIAVSADRLLDKALCERWPVSAQAHLQVVHQLTDVLARTGRTLH